MRGQTWLSSISAEGRQIVPLIVFCFVVGGWTLRIFPDPYNHDEGLTIFEWMWRKADSILHRDNFAEAEPNQM